MNSPFVIVGAGGLALDLIGWISNCDSEVQGRFKVTAFVTESKGIGDVCHGVPVESISAWREHKPRYVIAIGDPVQKKRIAQMLEAYGWIAETFVHHSVAMGMAHHIGPGTIICPHCRISTDATVGSHVLVNSSSGIGHDAVVGDYCTLLGAVSVNGNVQVGEGVLFGAGSMIYPGKKVGDWAKVGMGSVVLRNVRAGATVFGNPAQYIDG
jgi:acetyltransferase EpsM